MVLLFGNNLIDGKAGGIMENNWKAWIPHHDLENKYFICKVVDDEDGLQLFHISNDYTKKICVQFPGMVYAYRTRLELAALCTLDKIEDKTRGFLTSDWTFFVVENSAYAKRDCRRITRHISIFTAYPFCYCWRSSII